MDTRYTSDSLAYTLFEGLRSDFRNSGVPDRYLDLPHPVDAASYRAYKKYDFGVIDPYHYKAHSQITSIFSKYTFKSDAMDDKDRKRAAEDSYRDTQLRLPKSRPQSATAYAVLQRARRIIRSILGDFDLEEIYNHCYFGPNSSLGCPLSLAYPDLKLGMERAFTGSSASVQVFKKYLDTDPLLAEVVGGHLSIKKDSPDLDIRSIRLITVPKKWNTDRGITPLPLLDLFLSNGTGVVISKRLASAGLNIQTLQERHKRLVKAESIRLKHATADLSAASDSITLWLLRCLLPSKWYYFIRKFLFTSIEVNKEVMHTMSVLPMGNGCTFPLETLVFYSIIQALGELTGIKGIYSVYGDDLVYPVRLHKYVTSIFPHFGFVLNLDKTFVSYPFRESCGSDYYRGCDVRPFQFKAKKQSFTRTQFIPLLYSTVNGLLRRWDVHDIPETLTLLFRRICDLSGSVDVVPALYPDESGFKFEDFSALPRLFPQFLFNLPSYKTVSTKSGVHIQVAFSYWKGSTRFRLVKDQRAYYWNWLRLAELGEVSKCLHDLSNYSSQLLVWRRIQIRRGKEVIKKTCAFTALRRSTSHSKAIGHVCDWPKGVFYT